MDTAAMLQRFARRYGGSEARWFGSIELRCPVDNPLVVFDRSTRDLYSLEWEAP